MKTPKNRPSITSDVKIGKRKAFYQIKDALDAVKNEVFDF